MYSIRDVQLEHRSINWINLKWVLEIMGLPICCAWNVDFRFLACYCHFTESIRNFEGFSRNLVAQLTDMPLINRKYGFNLANVLLTINFWHRMAGIALVVLRWSNLSTQLNNTRRIWSNIEIHGWFRRGMVATVSDISQIFRNM